MSTVTIFTTGGLITVPIPDCPEGLDPETWGEAFATGVAHTLTVLYPQGKEPQIAP